MRPLSFLHIKERMEPIMFHLFLLLVLTVICVGGLLWVNRIMHLRLAYFFDLQERHRIICDVSLIINKNISRMQVGFENMLLASSEASLINAEEQIRECMETVHRGAVFLETGGVFIENFKVNFDGLDKVAHEFKLQKTMTGFSIASLELRSGLTMLEGMLHEYHAFTSARIAKQAKGQEDASQLGLMHKKLAPFFGRLIEHGNRFYVQSMKELAAIRIRLHQEEQRFMQAMYMVSAGAVLLLLLVGGAVTRSASQVLNERAEARKNLVAANEWLEERVATRTAALLASEGRLQDIALTSGDIIWQTDAQGQFIYVAGQTAKLLGISAEEIIGQSMSRFIADTAEGMEALHLLEQKMRNKEAMIDFVCPLLSAVDGCIRYFLINAIPMRQKDGGGFFGTSKDISEKMAYESRLRLLAKVFESAQEGITITDAQGTIEVVNPAFTTITGYTAAEAIGKNPRILKSEHHPPEFYQVMWDTLKHQGIWTGEIWNRRKSGEAYPEWLSITMVRDEAGAPRHYVAVFHDITAMKEKEAEITRMAYFDSLTSLPNRTMLLERFGVALMKAETTQRRYAVVYVDLDNFKLVNDSLGHEAGDYLLVEVARRFQSLVNGNDLIARLGGDEFVFLLEVQGEEPFDPLHYSNQIQQSLAAPIRVHELDIFITPSIGIALYPDDGRSAQTLLKHADLAMYSAKDTGKNQYVVFQEEMKAKVAVRLSLENHLRQALSRKEIFPVFQPKLCLHTQKGFLKIKCSNP